MIRNIWLVICISVWSGSAIDDPSPLPPYMQAFSWGTVTGRIASGMVLETPCARFEQVRQANPTASIPGIIKDIRSRGVIDLWRGNMQRAKALVPRHVFTWQLIPVIPYLTAKHLPEYHKIKYFDQVLTAGIWASVDTMLVPFERRFTQVVTSNADSRSIAKHRWWVGMPINLAVGSIAASSFWVFRKGYTDYMGQDNPGELLPFHSYVTMGIISGALNAAVVSPLATLRTCVCAQSAKGPIQWSWHFAKLIWKAHGLRGFYAGVGFRFTRGLFILGTDGFMLHWLENKVVLPVNRD